MNDGMFTKKDDLPGRRNHQAIQRLTNLRVLQALSKDQELHFLGRLDSLQRSTRTRFVDDADGTSFEESGFEVVD